MSPPLGSHTTPQHAASGWLSYRIRLAGVLGAVLLISCEADQGPVVEQSIDGTWQLEGLFASDIEGTVQCRLSGTLELEQLPGGVNTIVGNGTYDFDCIGDEESDEWVGGSALSNSRLSGTNVSLTFGDCGGEGQYDPTRPTLIYEGIAVCRKFTSDGTVFMLGTFEGYREVAP